MHDNRIPNGAAGKRKQKINLALRWSTVLPAILLILTIMIFPLLYNFYVSLRYVTLVNLRTNGVFTGLGNFVKLFGDTAFLNSMGTTFRYVIVTVVIQICLAFILAMLTYRSRKVLRYMTTICLLLPKMITPAASALIWRFMLNYETGIINYFLTLMGMDKIAFFTDAATAMSTLNMIGVWQNIGFSYLLILAGLMAMPYEIIEAALVDGASAFQRLVHIILPTLKQILVVVCLFAIINAFQAFDMIYMTTGGGPAETTQVAGIFLYRKLFMASHIGEAAAVSVILLVISFAISVVLVRALKKEETA